MKLGIKRRYLNALRSGVYAQGTHALCEEKPDGSCCFCILGVLANLFQESHPDEVCWGRGSSNLLGNRTLSISGSQAGLSARIRTWAGLSQASHSTLMVMNDTGHKKFKWMANWIQENVTITK